MFGGVKLRNSNANRKGVPAKKREQRRKDAETRQAAYNKLTIDEKIAKLDAGGFTANKQRHKFLMQKVKAKATAKG